MNLIDIIVLGIVFVAVGFAVRHIKKGKSTCGCAGNCENCASGCGCGKGL